MRCLKCNKPLPKSKRKDTLYCNDNCRVSYHRSRNKLITDKGQGLLPVSKTILSLCDYTGSWSKPYLDAGYNVIQVDLQHGQDVRLLKHPKLIYGILAAPPCTHFSSAGADSWARKGEKALLEALSIFDACSRIVLFTTPKFWVFENPIGRLKDYIGAPNHYFDPCDHGDAYRKRTCLWGIFNAPYSRHGKVVPRKSGTWESSQDMWLRENGVALGKKFRGDKRSVTPSGFAQAFFEANQ